MARTLVIGLTESGTKTTVNEDSFSCGDRVYPDMITGSEEQTRGSSAYTQLYIVTEGFGGSGAGDLAGRMLQRLSKDFAAKVNEYKKPALDFKKFSFDLIHEAHQRIREQIVPRDGQGAGVSFALLLIDANAAYVLNCGNTKLHLFRDGELYSLIDDSNPESLAALPSFVGDQRATLDPYPNAMKCFDLTAGDVVLLTSGGFHKGIHHTTLARDLSSADAFAANVRQAHIHSRHADNTVNGTILALKVRDLELMEPDNLAAKNMERYQIYHGAAPVSQTGQAPNKKYLSQHVPQESPAHDPVPYPGRPQQPGNMASSPAVVPYSESQQTQALPKEPALPNDQVKGDDPVTAQAKIKKRSNWKTFGLSLLLGFVVGIVSILVVWFFVIR